MQEIESIYVNDDENGYLYAVGSIETDKNIHEIFVQSEIVNTELYDLANNSTPVGSTNETLYEFAN